MSGWHMHGGDDAGPCGDSRCERPAPPRPLSPAGWLVALSLLAVVATLLVRRS